MSNRAEKLYRRFGPAIYSRCKRILREPAAAEDAAQEVFLRSLRHLEKIPDDKQALMWLYRVSTNYCLNVLRNRKKTVEIREETIMTEAKQIEQILGDREAVRSLMEKLPKKLGAPAMLHYLDDLDQGKVAEVLGVTRRTVINRLNEFQRRARKLLGRKGIAL